MKNKYHRTAIITGVTSGIGEATLRKFIESGYSVTGNGRNKEKIGALQKEFGDDFLGIIGDATKEEVVDRLFSECENHFGQPADLVVANAGRGLGGSIREIDPAEFEEVLSINVGGVLRLIQKAAQKMTLLQKKRFPQYAADIILIGSVSGRNISPFSSAYGSTKFAVNALAEGLRREVGPEGVRVSLIEPGIVISGFQKTAGYPDDLVDDFLEKFGPLTNSRDVAEAIYYVVSRPAHVHISDLMVRPTRQDYP